ncbi:hypothetical protein L3Q72_20015 [Vibrio sp. JC009]|uniref:hypothetical protein n=1 Tax=Vibrio sp. JC009 TaxID=2912314 RepID=UPI0023B012D4|nr:hypothetical protein [Vibrio sp. JC009]WED23529.1 hypothetical protein L3Q72_20015 [Vibrio sp. JC009]
MKSYYLYCLVPAIALTGCATEEHPQAAEDQPLTYTQAMIGTWKCEVGLTLSKKIHMHIKTEDSYIRNGRMNSYGLLTLTNPLSSSLPAIEYSVSSAGSWEFMDKFLVVNTDEMKIVNISHPGVIGVPDLQELFATNTSESAEVIDFLYDKITLKSETTNVQYDCYRKEPSYPRKL